MNNVRKVIIRQLRGWLEAILVALLIPVGGLLGGLTGFLPLSAIGAVLLPLLLAHYLLMAEGKSWGPVVFARRLSPLQIFGYTCLAVIGGYLLAAVASLTLQQLGFVAQDLSQIADGLNGNLTLYLWLMIPVVWGSAAIGEELLARGFLLHRIETLAGTTAAIVLQAVVFALGHAYQGVVGMVSIFFLALLFGTIFIRVGRNLLPLIFAHGIIDSIGVTLMYLGWAESIS